MSMDPVVTNPEHYKVLFENDRVRVLEYTDQPGDVTTPHQDRPTVTDEHAAKRHRPVPHGGPPVHAARWQTDLAEDDVDHRVDEIVFVGAGVGTPAETY